MAADAQLKKKCHFWQLLKKAKNLKYLKMRFLWVCSKIS